MAQKAAPRPLVVARRAEIAHILPHGLRRGVRLRLHQQTFPRVDDLVRAGAVEADPPVRRDGILRLVAVAPRLRRAEDLLHLDLAPTDARKIILHAPALEGKLLGIVHVAVGAAAAARKIRQSGAMRCGEGTSTSSTLAKAADFSTFRIRTRHTSPRSAPDTKTTKPSMRATPAPSPE